MVIRQKAEQSDGDDVGASSSRAGFEDLFHSEFAVMLRLARLLGSDDPEAIAQDAFTRLYARWDELADQDKAGGYVRSIVVNLVRSAGRHDGVARRHEASQPEHPPHPSAEFDAMTHVSDQQILAALEGLSPRHREALVLRFWLDLSERQMAATMGTSTGTVKSHVSRGLDCLRSLLATTSDPGTKASGGSR